MDLLNRTDSRPVTNGSQSQSSTDVHTAVPDTLDLMSHTIKWSWASRILDQSQVFTLDPLATPAPRAGDLALFCVERLSNHTRLVTTDNRKMRLYAGDLFVGVFGNRYATDAFEGEVLGTENLGILTAGGMVGTVQSRHQDIKSPTVVTFAGFVADNRGRRLNLKARAFHKAVPKARASNLIIVVGTGMNSGKTTTGTRLIHGLARAGLTVAACKLTGSVSNRDQDEMRAAAARVVVDFSDYGFPSTYLCPRDELVDLFHTMLADAEKVNPDVTIMEIADGVLQRETIMLLEELAVREQVAGIVLTADSAPAALYGVERLRYWKHSVVAVSGAITSAPLFMREFQENCQVPVGSSVGAGEELVELVRQHLSETTR